MGQQNITCSIYASVLGAVYVHTSEKGLTGLYFETQSRSDIARQRPCPVEISQWLDAYFRGDNPDPRRLQLSPAGTAFQMAVWEQLKQIPYGTTVSYGQIAKKLGPNMSAQAVGQAVGRNPISIIIPCHRVIGANGSLTGYAGGIDIKRWLLEHEAKTK